FFCKFCPSDQLLNGFVRYEFNSDSHVICLLQITAWKLPNRITYRFLTKDGRKLKIEVLDLPSFLSLIEGFIEAPAS
ncbi:MAG: hypothetical protein ACFFAD_10970, partial [Candidatus Hermodarchaeota archaeon]